ncbi:MAG: hypothetical protein A3F83_08235 [Candidatus Glassbacteria bacterium RIFCSPLOWO2_12_FULL_58_11]|uniref:Cupin 2 conserved barrel domain-containing protein n=2 Tax=Candidatus Glassiibacteriota TaxID=1817805 RepID=A0A1F5YWN1_9BACT|nr:MAG: hypothetical protein A2Z86_12315 [Candidatus Glassbacteria bacterium GWA2_58_10]OGG04600.1 MAG: hypothetical protein A3F83_08235 [Candidatus Glassbacteria bacterium RIFCSPLOWO2_12_FULL_58_11]
MLKVTRIFTSPDGESHFDEEEIELFDKGEIGRLSKSVPARGVMFRENEATYNYDWHTAPQRQYVVLLDGEIEIEVSDGEKRRFRGGDILLVEDTTGKGHRSRTVDNRSRRSLFIVLDQAADQLGESP